ncbi:hypothetical protein Agabi119p4_1276 [Agaricus bisporus var. burnettii]|uniref:Uncharacterized protein n=1 Tax=Agaricus bisporus var. burnettii TaxID=192524 RepID=A0A8H7KM06_AGABI|nr:hypothetical protein Agabi119p4_1276 [Agaricus bisporus var. burnettii]
MPAPRRNKQSQPASAPYLSRPPSQAPPPPANPTARRLLEDDIIAFVDPKYGGLVNLASFQLDFLENRAILDAIRNWGIAPQVAIANAAARSEGKGNVKGPLGHPSEIGAALPAVKTPLVLLSKRPLSPGSSFSGPSVAAALVYNSDDSSMAIEYKNATTSRPASPEDEEQLDSNKSTKAIVETINNAVGLFELLSSSKWKSSIISAFPTIMDNDIDIIHSLFTEKIPILRRILPPAVVVPASAVDALAPRVILRDAQPPAESSKAKPPKKKV